MNAKRSAIILINIAVFAGAGLVFYWLLHGGRLTVIPDDADTNHHTDAIVTVQVGSIARSTVHRIVTAYGQIEPSPAAKSQPAASVNVAVPGAQLVTDVACVEGQHVDAGQILFHLDSRAADAQAAEAQTLKTAAQDAVDALADAQTVPQWVIAAAKWERDSAQAALDRAHAQQQWCTVTAPISGMVTTVNIRAGQVADAATPAVEIVDLDRLVAALDVPGFDARLLRPGQSVTVEISSPPGNSVATQGATTEPSVSLGSIVRVDPAANADTGMVSTDVALAASSGLRPGQFVRGQIDVETHADCLVVPADAIVTDADLGPRIALITDSHRAYFQSVEIGIRQGDLVEIHALPDAAPLTEGERIAIKGAYALPPAGCNIVEADR